MIRDFSKDELEAAANGRDTELTLGSGTLIILGCGLLVLCAVCFSIGYSVGHRPAPGGAATSLTDKMGISVPASSGSKPGAAGQPSTRPPLVDAVTNGSGGARTPAETQTAAAVGSSGAQQNHVRQALDSPANPAPVGQTGEGQPHPVLQVQPAMAQVQGWMVQIAAVSHAEDAEVLVNALRKRGYKVAARREVGDNLIHVQTGPFVNRNDANAMRQRLLNDGYNAIVE